MNHLVTSCLLVLLDLCLAPSLHFVDRFPHIPRCEIAALCRFNRDYQEKLRDYLEVNPDNQMVHLSLKEASILWKAWDSLDDARNEIFSIRRRRESLGTLLNIIGPEAFVEGRMPYHLPLWRFVEVR